MNFINIIVVVIMVGGPILGRIIDQGNKKRKARQEQKEAEARQLEALRTGRISTETPSAPPRAAPQSRARPSTTVSTSTRPTTTPARNATERMQELARKRQQQLEELRRRQQSARQQASRNTGQTAPGPQRRPANQPQAQTSPAQRQRKPGVARQQKARPEPAPRPRILGETPTSHPTTSRSALHELPIDEHVLHPATEAPPSAAQPIALLGKRMTPADWRRFIVARELLDPPLALREQDGGLPH